MKSAKRYTPEIDAFLAKLEEAFERTRKNTVALYPYDKRTNTITLPPDVEKTLRQLILSGEKIEAVKRVTELTGAGLRVSKDYVDNLAANIKRTSK
jgi:ribosomal protein L7/L12